MKERLLICKISQPKLVLTYTSRGPLSRFVVGPAVFIIVPDDTAIHVPSLANCRKGS